MKPNSKLLEKRRIETVDLVLSIFSALAGAQGISAVELATATGVDASVACSILGRLADRGFV